MVVGRAALPARARAQFDKFTANPPHLQDDVYALKMKIGGQAIFAVAAHSTPYDLMSLIAFTSEGARIGRSDSAIDTVNWSR
jgi:hypothetical protein